MGEKGPFSEFLFSCTSWRKSSVSSADVFHSAFEPPKKALRWGRGGRGGGRGVGRVGWGRVGG